MKECPKENYVFAETLALEIKAGKKLKEERQKMLCKYGVDPMAAVSELKHIYVVSGGSLIILFFKK